MNPSIPRRLFKHEQAKTDLIEIYAYLAQRSDTAARRFLEETRKAFELILEIPGIGKRWDSPVANLQKLRVTCVSRRFRNHLIFYRPVTGGVQIVTILHGARDLQTLIDTLDADEMDRRGGTSNF